MRARPEPFGAWVRIDDGTLVAVTRPAARRLGLDGGALWRDDSGDGSTGDRAAPPLEVHLAVTSRCGAGCKGCYLDAAPDGEMPPYDVLVGRLRAIADAGVFTVAFGGGEPLTRPDLGELGAVARELGLTPVVTTSGFGMTRERAESLRSFAQVNVSYDGEATSYAAVRGFDGARAAERAMQALAAAGVPFGVNIVLTRATFPSLPRTVERAEELGAREAQLLRYKPAGRARSPEYLAARLSPAQIDALVPVLERIIRERSLGVRVDCSMIPLLSAGRMDAAALVRFGVLGCEAGRHLAAVRIDGLVSPCSFGPPSGTSASTGGRAEAEAGTGAETEAEAGAGAETGAGTEAEAGAGAETGAGTGTGAGAGAEAGALTAWSGGALAWREDPVLAAWRAPHDAEPCRSCPLREVCRGGCRVVASHLEGSIGPDPECPRVRAYRSGNAITATHGDPA